MELETFEDFGQLVIVTAGMIDYKEWPGQIENFEFAISKLQSDARYRPWLEQIEVDDYPEELHLVDEMFGINKLRPWLDSKGDNQGDR